MADKYDVTDKSDTLPEWLEDIWHTNNPNRAQYVATCKLLLCIERAVYEVDKSVMDGVADIIAGYK